MNYYSCHDQDRWVLEEILPGKRNGYFVEAGALSGAEGSNTLCMERHLDWTGILIEPDPSFFPQLKQNRKAICLDYCLSGQRRTVQFIASGNGYSGIEDRLHPWHKDQWSKGTTITREAVPLQDVLRECNAPHVIDYLSLDVEGAEVDILCQFPFDEYRFLALTIETDLCDALLKANGYLFHRWSPEYVDTFYYWHELADQVAAIAAMRGASA